MHQDCEDFKKYLARILDEKHEPSVKKKYWLIVTTANNTMYYYKDINSKTGGVVWTANKDNAHCFSSIGEAKTFLATKLKGRQAAVLEQEE